VLLQLSYSSKSWSFRGASNTGMRGTNPPLFPLSYRSMERDTRIELVIAPWQGTVLPLHQPRINWIREEESNLSFGWSKHPFLPLEDPGSNWIAAARPCRIRTCYSALRGGVLPLHQ
jgi:hypothetical protein